MDASEIIRAFGGASKVAEITGSTRTAVCNWRRDGIPAKFWLKIIEAASAAGVDGVTADAVAWRPSRTAEAAAFSTSEQSEAACAAHRDGGQGTPTASPAVALNSGAAR